jgi:hypothetical protein
MRNIFKTFKENKRLEEENKLLKAQNEALTEFRKSFDNYYNNISCVKVITRNYDKQVVIKASHSLDRDSMYCPVDVCKEDIARKMARELLPLIEFDIVDNKAYGIKEIVGRLIVMTR